MGNFMSNVQPAVKKETKKQAAVETKKEVKVVKAEKNLNLIIQIPQLILQEREQLQQNGLTNSSTKKQKRNVLQD